MCTGISNEDVRKCWDIGITGIDIQGVGGTSLARVETVKRLPLVEKQSCQATVEPFDFLGDSYIMVLIRCRKTP